MLTVPMMSEPKSIKAVSANILLFCGKDNSLFHFLATFEQDEEDMLVLSSGEKGLHKARIRYVASQRVPKLVPKRRPKKRQQFDLL